MHHDSKLLVCELNLRKSYLIECPLRNTIPPAARQKPLTSFSNFSKETFQEQCLHYNIQVQSNHWNYKFEIANLGTFYISPTVFGPSENHFEMRQPVFENWTTITNFSVGFSRWWIINWILRNHSNLQQCS